MMITGVGRKEPEPLLPAPPRVRPFGDRRSQRTLNHVRAAGVLLLLGGEQTERLLQLSD